jgi:hypothetical protein
MNLREIKQLARTLTPEQMTKLHGWLQTLIEQPAKVKRRREAKAQHKIIEERSVENKTYRLEGVRCGKEKCRCVDGDMHGPYWYAYWSERGRTRSQYIGKKLPRRNIKL